MKNNMKLDGVCFLASKVYYYGVGGSLYDFESLLEENNFKIETVYKNHSKFTNKREIIKISF